MTGFWIFPQAGVRPAVWWDDLPYSTSMTINLHSNGIFLDTGFFREGTIMMEYMMEEHIRRLEHKLYFLLDFIGENDLWHEAMEYLEEHEDDPIPFGIRYTVLSAGKRFL